MIAILSYKEVPVKVRFDLGGALSHIAFIVSSSAGLHAYKFLFGKKIFRL